MAKDWATILKDYSSGEESDAHDGLNVMSVRKNAHRVSEIVHAVVPGFDPSQARTLPIGTNGVSFIREGLAASIAAQSRRSDVSQKESSSTSGAPPSETTVTTGTLV